jgi:ankyrin repeat protein
MTPIIEILIEYGALIDSRTKNNFRTPLHMACLRGHFSAIQTLLTSGAEADAKDIDMNTPCHFVAEFGHRDCLRFLLTKHPTLFSKNNDGKSPIDMACNHEILQVSF